MFGTEKQQWPSFLAALKELGRGNVFLHMQLYDGDLTMSLTVLHKPYAAKSSHTCPKGSFVCTES